MKYILQRIANDLIPIPIKVERTKVINKFLFKFDDLHAVWTIHEELTLVKVHPLQKQC